MFRSHFGSFFCASILHFLIWKNRMLGLSCLKEGSNVIIKIFLQRERSLSFIVDILFNESFSLKTKLFCQFNLVYPRKLFIIYNIQYMWYVSHFGSISPLIQSQKHIWRIVNFSKVANRQRTNLLKPVFTYSLFWRFVMRLVVLNRKKPNVIQ